MPDTEADDDRREIAALMESRELVERAERRESALWVKLWPKLSAPTKLARWRAVAEARLNARVPVLWQGRHAHATVLPPTYDGRSFARGEWL